MTGIKCLCLTASSPTKQNLQEHFTCSNPGNFVLMTQSHELKVEAGTEHPMQLQSNCWSGDRSCTSRICAINPAITLASLLFTETQLFGRYGPFANPFLIPVREGVRTLTSLWIRAVDVTMIGHIEGFFKGDSLYKTPRAHGNGSSPLY